MPKKPRTTATRSRSASRRRSIVAEDLLDLVGVSDPQISPDGTRILFTRSEVDGNRTVRNLWIVETDGRSDAKPLTTGGHDRHGRWSADGGRIAFVRGGDPKAGRPQIAILDLAGGEARIATDLPEGTLRDLQWSPDGRGIAFAFRPLGEERTRAAKERREREGLSDPPRIVEDPWYRLDGDGYFLGDRFRLDWLDLDAGSVRTLFDRDRIGEFAYDVSPDGRTIAITARTTKSAVLDSHRTDLLLIDVATGKARKVEGAPDGPKHAVAFSPDGRHLAIAARTGDDGLYSPRNLGLWAGPVKGRGWRDLLAGTDWCLMAATLSDSRDASFAATLRWAPDGTRILAKIGWHGSGRIASVPIDGSTPRFLTEEGVELSLGNLSHDGRRAALAIGDATTPDEIALGEVSRTAIRVSTLTDFNATFVASRAIAAPIEHWVESTDGVKVQVWELRPPGVSDSSRTPAILEVHGGPHAQYGLTFFHEFQCLAAAGYTVFFSNPRGSKGYGESFCSAIRGSWGEKDWQDVSGQHRPLQPARPLLGRCAVGSPGGPLEVEPDRALQGRADADAHHPQRGRPALQRGAERAGARGARRAGRPDAFRALSRLDEPRHEPQRPAGSSNPSPAGDPRVVEAVDVTSGARRSSGDGPIRGPRRTTPWRPRRGRAGQAARSSDGPPPAMGGRGSPTR
jgi:dipeptidyl aminopeptidase/acylaminoacyl peptidase